MLLEIANKRLSPFFSTAAVWARRNRCALARCLARAAPSVFPCRRLHFVSRSVQVRKWKKNVDALGTSFPKQNFFVFSVHTAVPLAAQYIRQTQRSGGGPWAWARKCDGWFVSGPKKKIWARPRMVSSFAYSSSSALNMFNRSLVIL